MQRYRVTGAYRDSGDPFEGDFIALSEGECAEQARLRGILVSVIQPAPAVQDAPRKPRTRIRAAAKDPEILRALIRGIATVNAYLLMIPGMVMLASTLVLLLFFSIAWIASLFREDPSPTEFLGLSLSAAFSLTGIVWSLLLMLASAVLFLLLFVEDHLYAIRHQSR